MIIKILIYIRCYNPKKYYPFINSNIIYQSLLIKCKGSSVQRNSKAITILFIMESLNSFMKSNYALRRLTEKIIREQQIERKIRKTKYGVYKKGRASSRTHGIGGWGLGPVRWIVQYKKSGKHIQIAFHILLISLNMIGNHLCNLVNLERHIPVI